MNNTFKISSTAIKTFFGFVPVQRDEDKKVYIKNDGKIIFDENQKEIVIKAIQPFHSKEEIKAIKKDQLENMVPGVYFVMQYEKCYKKSELSGYKYYVFGQIVQHSYAQDRFLDIVLDTFEAVENYKVN